MNKKTSLLLLSLALCGFSISTMEASKYPRGRAQDDSEEEEEPRNRFEILRNRIRKATKPEVTLEEEFNAFKKELEQDIRIGKIATKDFDIPGTLDVGNCMRRRGSFREWLTDSIYGCDNLSGEYLGVLSEAERPGIIAKHKATYKDEKERLLEVQEILGLKLASTRSLSETDEESGTSITMPKIPFKLVGAGLLACIGIGLWYFFGTSKKSKAPSPKGSDTK